MYSDITKRIHRGVILDASPGKFDSGGATFGSVFVDKEDPSVLYLFYTGSTDVHWSSASIGLATSNDGLNFRKADALNPVIDAQKPAFCSELARNPVVTRVGNHFYMVLCGKASARSGMRIGLAHADDPRGSWKTIGQLIQPRRQWEGNDIDVGPCIVRINDDEFLVFYSNVSMKWRTRLLSRQRFLLRRIGLLRLRIRSPSKFEAWRYDGNPLMHLNGPRGSWNESLFCPGYLEMQEVHNLFPAASTYSHGFPYKQFIGRITDATPYFQKPKQINILINGSLEKDKIIPSITSEIALDAPCPLIREDKLFLYYAVMDRANHIWKTALTIFNVEKQC